MTATDIFGYAGTAASVVAAFVLVKAAWQTQTTKVWREEAEAQRTRADRLQDDMDEVKTRLAHLEAKNQRLIDILTTVDPEKLAALRI
ncbi:hypothetical protein [Streptomyces alfalfae]|uniref:hypothetical protein n=1 Tax=Streptomyces alfalfae TaxID=1642299 RepID=UPI001FD09E02|nr:hypothetical protein [Streptomyces alfalfae]